MPIALDQVIGDPVEFGLKLLVVFGLSFGPGLGRYW